MIMGPIFWTGVILTGFLEGALGGLLKMVTMETSSVGVAGTTIFSNRISYLPWTQRNRFQKFTFLSRSCQHRLCQVTRAPVSATWILQQKLAYHTFWHGPFQVTRAPVSATGILFSLIKYQHFWHGPCQVTRAPLSSTGILFSLIKYRCFWHGTC